MIPAGVINSNWYSYEGYWSVVGTDSENLLTGIDQSMNLEGYDVAPFPEPEFSRIVIHEFGHALGLHHEHQHPFSKCEDEFDWPRVTKYLTDLGWSSADITSI